MDEDTFREQLVKRLDIIIRLLLESPQADKPSNMTEVAGRLDEMGLSTAEIATVLGKASKDVSTSVRRYKKSRGKAKK